jgi:hypothetical protein
METDYVQKPWIFFQPISIEKQTELITAVINDDDAMDDMSNDVENNGIIVAWNQRIENGCLEENVNGVHILTHLTTCK